MCSKWCIILSLIITLAVASCGAAETITRTKEYYTAGVVEFRPAMGAMSSAQQLEENLIGYLELIESANGTTDIIVFPEATLNNQLQLTVVPEPSNQTLCHQLDSEIADFLHRIACAAIEAQSYLVLNVKERENCLAFDNDCPSRGYRLYNTNVVLDRRGAVVSRYRKWNLYLEPQLNRTKEPEYAIFETDFNVTFGHFICFDMLFYIPSQELVERYNLQNIIVTKMFNSELPFLTASQLQQGWAWANNVNLLAAGANLPQAGMSGSGIYAGQRGALVRHMAGGDGVATEESVRQLLLARVPRTPQLFSSNSMTLDAERSGEAHRGLLLLQQPEMSEFASLPLPLLNGSMQQFRLCQADLCCNFELSLQVPQGQLEYNYRLGAFVGQRTYEEAEYSVVRLCGLFTCRNASVNSCGLLSEELGQQGQARGEPLTFNVLRVSGEFVARPRRLLMPSTLSTALYALQATEVGWSLEQQHGGQSLVELHLKKPHSQLLTFAIYGNYFDEFSQGGGATTAWGNSCGICCIAVAIVFLWSLRLLHH